MSTSLPSRPNLDHLRRQAKDLLASLRAGDAAAAQVLREHLPAAARLTDDQIRAAGYRLADAQSAIARKSGFAAWQQLARHVELLRGLEGTWRFATLEIEGAVIPREGLAASRILIDGDRFRTESPEGNYEGVFNIDVEAEPQRIEIEFVEGPEAGNRNFGIFRLEGDVLEFCIDVQGKPAPKAFCSAAGSGHAYERLERADAARPEAVTGGTRKPAAVRGPETATAAVNTKDFEYRESPTLAALQGVWDAEQLIRDGNGLPGLLLKTASRRAEGNRLTVRVAGQVMVDALVRICAEHTPIEVDYLLQSGQGAGQIQKGILEWREGAACFCMGAIGGERPEEFASAPGSGQTLSVWRKRK